MVAASLLSTLLLALAIAAKPVEQNASLVKLAFVKRVSTGTTILVKQDRLRVNNIKAGRVPCLENCAGSAPAENRAISYVASVGVGHPPTDYDLIIDTGSSNTWIGSGKDYVRTSTSFHTSDSVSVPYGSGNFSGTEYIDRVTIASDLVIFRQSIGVAKTSTGFSTVDGILGVGPTDLTNDTLTTNINSTIPTVTDNLYAQGTITKDVLSISFEPYTDHSGKQQWNGELTWGGTDSSKFTGSITYMPITTISPSNTYWGFDASISYGGAHILSTTAGIVDTGTTLVLIATDAFDSYRKATGGVLDKASGLLSITSTQYDKLKSFFIHVNGVAFELTPNAQIWPRNFNADVGGIAGKIYLIVSDIGTKSGSGMDFILGQAFLERFYSVHDTGNSQVGLATTSFTYATTN